MRRAAASAEIRRIRSRVTGRRMHPRVRVLGGVAAVVGRPREPALTAGSAVCATAAAGVLIVRDRVFVGTAAAGVARRAACHVATGIAVGLALGYGRSGRSARRRKRRIVKNVAGRSEDALSLRSLSGKRCAVHCGGIDVIVIKHR